MSIGPTVLLIVLAVVCLLLGVAHFAGRAHRDGSGGPDEPDGDGRPDP